MGPAAHERRRRRIGMAVVAAYLLAAAVSVVQFLPAGDANAQLRVAYLVVTGLALVVYVAGAPSGGANAWQNAVLGALVLSAVPLGYNISIITWPGGGGTASQVNLVVDGLPWLTYAAARVAAWVADAARSGRRVV
ncbi:MAG: hypothetical protein ABEJ08_05435 [Halobacteriaceae archaeon]